MSLQVFNTLGRRKAPFVPIASGQVGLYVCGVTVYDLAHVGHARSALVFDVVRRHLHDGFAPRTALDFGCGVGRLALPLARRCRSVVGVDVSGGMLEKARSRSRQCPIGLYVRLTITETPVFLAAAERRERAEHVDLAVREVDEPQHAEEDGEAHRDQRVHAADRQRIHQLLNPDFHAAARPS